METLKPTNSNIDVNRYDVDVQNVAAYIVAKNNPTGTMFLQLMVYYAQAWYIALHGARQPLFKDPIEAWRMVPGINVLYQNHKGKNVVEKWEWGDPDKLTERMRMVIDYVYNMYSALSGFHMGELTRTEDPWIHTYNQGFNTEITQESIFDFYSKYTEKFFPQEFFSEGINHS